MVLRRCPPAWSTDVPVLVLLVASWALIAVPWAHAVAGLAGLGWVGLHLATRRRLGRRLRRVSARALSAGAVVLTMAATTVTGVLRMVGVPRDVAWHGSTGYLLLAAMLWHLWTVRRRLRARLKAARRPSERAEWEGSTT